jgi:hypothetical protein
MARLHPKPWHQGSEFGPGPRRPLDRERRARWRYLVHANARAGRIAPKGEWVLEELLAHLSKEGRCDPSYARLGADAATSSKTAERAVAAAAACGLLRWQRRIVRNGWRAEQTSNAYELLVPGDAEPRPHMPTSRAIKLESCSIATLSIAGVTGVLAGPLPGFQERFAAKIAEERRIRAAPR